MSFADDLRYTSDGVNYYKTDVAQKLKDAMLENQKNIIQNYFSVLMKEVKDECKYAAREGDKMTKLVPFDGIYYYYDGDGRHSWLKFNIDEKKVHNEAGWLLDEPIYADYRFLKAKGFGDLSIFKPIPDEYVDVVLSRYFIFSKDAAEKIKQELMNYLTKEGLKLNVNIEWHTTFYKRKPSGKLFDKKVKNVEYTKPHAVFNIYVSW